MCRQEWTFQEDKQDESGEEPSLGVVGASEDPQETLSLLAGNLRFLDSPDFPRRPTPLPHSPVMLPRVSDDSDELLAGREDLHSFIISQLEGAEEGEEDSLEELLRSNSGEETDYDPFLYRGPL